MHPADHFVALFGGCLGILEDNSIGTFRNTPIDSVLEITLGVVLGCFFPLGAIVGDQREVFEHSVIFHDLEILSSDEVHLTRLAGPLHNNPDVVPVCQETAVDEDLIMRADLQRLAWHRTGDGGKKAAEGDHSCHRWRETSAWQVVVHGDCIIGWTGSAAGLLRRRFRNILSSLHSEIKLRENRFSRPDLREAEEP